MSFIDSVLDNVDSILAWLSMSVQQTAASYCDIQTADDVDTLVAHDGSLVTIVRVEGATALIGQEEFDRLHTGFSQGLQSTMSRPGHTLQVFFNYDMDEVRKLIEGIYLPATGTAQKLNLDLADLFEERINYLANYCAKEDVYIAIWTRPSYLSDDQLKSSRAAKLKHIRETKTPPFVTTQNINAAIPDLREVHSAFARSMVEDLHNFSVSAQILDAHTALRAMRFSVDPDFTDQSWQPVLPGDQITPRITREFRGSISDILWPPIAKQLLPRDAENLDLRTCRIGDRIYSSVFIELFPKEIKPFLTLFNRVLNTQVPWRISFLIESSGAEALSFKGLLATLLSFASQNNRLLSDGINLIKYLNVNTDDAIIKLRVTATTWAPADDVALLRTRSSELAKAIQGWGSCDISEVCGDPFAGTVSSMLGISGSSVATTTVAPPTGCDIYVAVDTTCFAVGRWCVVISFA